jgi:hypothetical protein
MSRVRSPSPAPAALLAASAALLACAGDAPVGPIAPPDLSKLIAFFPLDGSVRGRGSAGAAPAGSPFVYISVHPGRNNESIFPVAEDGSFEFEVRAGSEMTLEIAGAKNDDLENLERGDPSYIRVPLAIVFADDYYCCKVGRNATGKCVAATEEAPVCDGDIEITKQCRADDECAIHASRTLDFPSDALIMSPPDARGIVSIRTNPGRLPPLTLVRLENRGKRAVGGRDPRFKRTAITDDDGNFTMSIPARGDDELVFELFDFSGRRSRQNAVLVPDAEYVGVDVVGVFPFKALAPGRPGSVGIRISPVGADQYGICPNSTSDPVLCFTGGLDYSMVRLDAVIVDSADVTARVVPTPTGVDLPNNRATDGDVLSGPQVLTLILDGSAVAAEADPEGARFDAAVDFANALRSRDRLAVLVVGDSPDGWRVLVAPTNDKAALRNAIRQLEGTTPDPTAPRNFFGAVGAVPDLTTGEPGFSRGKALVIALSTPEGTLEAAVQTLGRIDPDVRERGDEYAVYVVRLDLSRDLQSGTGGADRRVQSQLYTELGNLASYSGGDTIDVFEPGSIVQAVARVTGEIAGAYVLLYDVPIPAEAGKAASVEVRATVTLLDASNQPVSHSATYSGTIEVRDASN